MAHAAGDAGRRTRRPVSGEQLSQSAAKLGGSF